MTDLPNKLSSLMLSLNLVTQFPKTAVIPRIPPLKPVKLPTSLEAPEANALNKSTPIPTTENIPLNVDLSLSAFADVNSLNFAERSLIRSVRFNSCSAVVGGNTSLKASFTGLIMFNKPEKEFFIASIAIVRPPLSAHACNKLLRASADLPIASLK